MCLAEGVICHVLGCYSFLPGPASVLFLKCVSGHNDVYICVYVCNYTYRDLSTWSGRFFKTKNCFTPKTIYPLNAERHSLTREASTAVGSNALKMARLQLQ